MSDKPEPKFKVGQVVALRSLEKYFRVLDVVWHAGEWCYQWSRYNAAAEHMLRPLTTEEKGSHD